jgi:hypothetical protein
MHKFSRTHDVELNLDLPPSAFKDAIYRVTGVPPDRVKVMVEGGVLKVRRREMPRNAQSERCAVVGSRRLEKNSPQSGEIDKVF